MPFTTSLLFTCFYICLTRALLLARAYRLSILYPGCLVVVVHRMITAMVCPRS
jgi:hypothetical protein